MIGGQWWGFLLRGLVAKRIGSRMKVAKDVGCEKLVCIGLNSSVALFLGAGIAWHSLAEQRASTSESNDGHRRQRAALESQALH